MARRLRTAASAALAAVLLAGVPWALGRLAGLPLPGRPGSGPVIAALAGAAWLLWAVFTAALAAEVTARACGRTVPRVPAIAPVQALAAALAGTAVITVLHLPGDAGRTAPPAHATLAAATAAPPRAYRVAAGDDLWDIAARFLGDPGGWARIFRLNHGRPQPGGGTLADPRLIRPGWVLLIPQPDGQPRAAPHAPRPGAGPRGTSQPPPPSPRPSRPAPGPGQTARGRPAPHAARPHPAAVRLPSGAVIGIAVAAMVVAALAVAAVQRRRRYRPRPGLPAGPPPCGPPRPEPIPALRRAAQARAPGTGEADRDPGGLPDPVTAGPGSVPPGTRSDGSEAAADLTRLRGLGLAGPGAVPAARAILTSLLAQLPPGHSAGPPVIIIPAADAARLLPGAGQAAVPGVSVPATLDAALDEMEALLLTRARAAAPGPGPGVTLIAAAGARTAGRLAGILAAGHALGAAAVLLGGWPAGTTCQVAAGGTVTAVTPASPALDQVRLYTLGAADASAITGVLREAAGHLPDGPAPAGTGHASREAAPAPDRNPTQGGGLPLAGPAARPGPAPAGTGPEPARAPGPADRLVQVSVLGPLRITAGGQGITGGLRKARELLALLAVHPGGLSGEAISEALHPGASPGQGTSQRNLALRKARELLRTAAGLPGPLFILNASGRYRLDPALIGTDLEAFSAALEQARTAAGEARLAACRRAVALYRGELADGAGYEWAEPHAETARRRALDAWTAIAEIHWPSDPGQALSALETALTHDPYNEYLYVKIMRLQAAAGHPEAARRTLALLESRLTDLGLTPSSQTRQAAAALLAAGPGA
jgi:DNA-binding SARP family transcriptional activator